MKNYIMAIFILLTSLSVWGQEIQRSSLVSYGSSVEISLADNDYYVSQSIGQEIITGTHGGSIYVARQGYQQPPLEVGTILTPGENLLNARVYPNPVKERLTIDFVEKTKTAITIVVFDVLGRLVLEESRPASSSTNIDFSLFRSGNYYLKVNANASHFSTKLIKN